MVTQGLGGAATAQPNGHPGLARSRDRAAQWVYGGLENTCQFGLHARSPAWRERLCRAELRHWKRPRV